MCLYFLLCLHTEFVGEDPGGGSYLLVWDFGCCI